MVIAVPVIVNVAVRWAPVLGARLNWTMPFPDPEAPWVTVRNAALLTAVQLQLEVVVTEMDADPPAAGKVVVVTPVMIEHDPAPGAAGFVPLPQAMAISRSAADNVTLVRRVI